MKTFRNKYNYVLSDIDFLDFNISDTVFFDIETTGFAASHTRLYLIGCLYYDEACLCFRTVQWFLDDVNDEPAILVSFFEFISQYKSIVHFNGDGFDIPYIRHKCEKFNIPDGFDNLTSIDLYKISSGLKKVLKTANLKQKTLEQFLGISREDKFSGDELIKVYENYLKNRDDSSLALLLLHNLDDIKGLLNLMSIFYYRDLFNGGFNVHSISVENSMNPEKKKKKEVIVELNLKHELPSRISNGNELFYMTAFNKKAKLRILVYTEELKYFYPNYRDYYYLPEEDCSIHKSVAFYVDKNFRTQAKAANCYSKKTGQFLPQTNEIISPYFKIEYNDKITYFEITDDFLQDASLIRAYASHVLANILAI